MPMALPPLPPVPPVPLSLALIVESVTVKRAADPALSTPPPPAPPAPPLPPPAPEGALVGKAGGFGASAVTAPAALTGAVVGHRNILRGELSHGC